MIFKFNKESQNEQKIFPYKRSMLCVNFFVLSLGLISCLCFVKDVLPYEGWRMGHKVGKMALSWHAFIHLARKSA